MTRPIGWREHLFGLILCVTYVAMLLATANDLAMSRDESFYVSAAEQYGRWFETLAKDPADALTRETIDRFWVHNHEHPSLPKSLFALSNLAQEKWQIFDTASKAHRFPAMVSAGLILWLIFIFGARSYGRAAGAFAALAFAAMPRPFYHAHLNCFDVPIVLTTLFTTYCYWRSLEKPSWALMAGIALGLSLETKHNTWILPGIYLIHWTFVVWRERRRRKSGRDERATYVPWWFFGMLVLGPAIFILLWPWMWHDTLVRLDRYGGFHVNHEHYVYQFLGESWWEPPFPVSVPFVLTWYTLPAITCLLALAGIASRARALLPAGLDARFWRNGRVEADARATDVLFFGCLLAPMLAIALPTSPIFGGTKHWFTAYPFLALFAGVGFRRLAIVAQRIVHARLPRAVSTAVPVLLAGVCLAPAVVQTAHAHPMGLAFYSYPAGGLPGAADDGMNRHFWGYIHGGLADWFRETMPDGGTVYLCDATWGSWHMMQRDGLIPDNIRGVGDIGSADYAMVHHEEHFAEVDFQAWMAYGSVEPVKVLSYDGVPMVSVYENPRVRARAERRQAAEERGERIRPPRRAPSAVNPRRNRVSPRVTMDAAAPRVGRTPPGVPVAPSGSLVRGARPIRELDRPAAADVDPRLEGED